ncbi:MAG: chromosome partitioning protein ParB [Spirochaetae bacterium HGW-Spirochaetae-10]|nr:MAG: chromosome partitioning protein ParB [Spirochaetae bacterium HGW-Spirochaetae-10]
MRSCFSVTPKRCWHPSATMRLFRSPLCRGKTGCFIGRVCILWCVHLRIRDIRIPRRIRRRKIQIDDLVESIAEFGLLQPIIVDTENTLIAGYRRLEAARALGWESIDVRVIDAPERKDRLLLEIEENSVRQDFDREELERARALLRRYERSGPVWRAWNWLLDVVDRLFKV